MEGPWRSVQYRSPIRCSIQHGSQKWKHREFPGDPVVGLHALPAEGLCSIPGRGTKNPQAVQHGQKKKNEAKLYRVSAIELG